MRSLVVVLGTRMKARPIAGRIVRITAITTADLTENDFL
jgi:hypothetical protein